MERPANAVRSVMRQFTSELLDKPWYDDRDMWPRYLDMLAAHRFNRFHLAFGLGYDFLDHVADAYLLFAYPFLLATWLPRARDEPLRRGTRPQPGHAAVHQRGSRTAAHGEIAWPGIDADVAQMEARLATAAQSDDPRVAAAIAEALGRPRRDPIACEHRPPARFRPGEALPLEIRPPAGGTFVSISLFYRHVSQAERWQEIPMTRAAAAWRASIPASYTDSPHPLQYYFRLARGPQRMALYPGLSEDLLDQPYFVVRRESVDVVR